MNWYKLLLTGDERALRAEAIADQEPLAKQQAEQKQQQAEQKSERLAAKLRALGIAPDETYSKYRSNPPQNNLPKRLKADATMMKPIKSILIRNSINSHSDS